MKVIAIYICYTTFVYIPFYLKTHWQYMGDKIWFAITLSVFISIGVIFAWLAFKFAKSLASDICKSEQESIVTQIDKAQLEQVVFRVLGLYLFATHLRPAVDKAVYIQHKVYDVMGSNPDLYSQRVSLIVELILIGIATSFILKPRFWQEKFKSWDANKMTPPSRPFNATSTSMQNEDSSSPQS